LGPKRGREITGDSGHARYNKKEGVIKGSSIGAGETGLVDRGEALGGNQSEKKPIVAVRRGEVLTKNHVAKNVNPRRSFCKETQDFEGGAGVPHALRGGSNPRRPNCRVKKRGDLDLISQIGKIPFGQIPVGGGGKRGGCPPRKFLVGKRGRSSFKQTRNMSTDWDYTGASNSSSGETTRMSNGGRLIGLFATFR